MELARRLHIRRPAMIREPHSVPAPRVHARPARRVMVADDDGDMLALIERSLRRDGYEVELVHGGPQLMERLARPPVDRPAPELLITDVQMPETSGLDVLRWMRAHGFHQPVILVTAYPHTALDDQADALGATMVLAKPFELRQLTALVRRTLEGQT